MKLNESINVTPGYTRSINLERDSDELSVINGYIPTSRALRTIARVSDSLHDGAAQRAWSLVGPYGSGKSSFALFLSHLLGKSEGPHTIAARAVLNGADPSLVEGLNSDAGTHLRVLVTGSPEPLAQRLLTAIQESANSFYKHRPGTSPKILGRIQTALDEDGPITVSSFLVLLKDLASALHRSGIAGLCLVIDELGKFLEFEARHYGANDVYLLQALAEHAARPGEFRLLLFVLLHQSFEQYAKGLGEELKREWGKIQGRFEEIPFLESEEQILRVVSAAFEPSLSSAQLVPIRNTTNDAAKRLAELGALPGMLGAEDAATLFLDCYPLHPTTALLLPSLCQKIAQNERTLFSFLGSHEEYGLSRHMEQRDVGDFVLPADVFDYFVANQTAVMGDYSVHRRWVEVQTALDRLGDANDDLRSLLKTIGLFNIVGAKGEFKPSRELLATIFTNKAKLTRQLNLLQERGLVTYRKFNREYRIWQGSDFDLEASLEAETANLGHFALSEELNKSDQLVPIVARKHSIETGALRYFLPLFVDARNYLKTPQSASDPRVIFFLAFGEDDKHLFDRLPKYFSDTDILVRCATSEKLRDAVAEVICLRRIQASSAELSGDPVAKREFEDRLFTAATTEQHLIHSFLNEPQVHHWEFRGETIEVQQKRDLQAQLSRVLRSIYPKTPIVFNELINRDRPSTQANAARNKLLLAMQEGAHLPDLGIQKFPAEKAIYRALLRETGIHGYSEQLDADCYLTAPNENASQIHHVWERIDQFLESTESEARSFVDLNQELMAPPYGVKAGLLPVLYFATYLVNQGELALYENRKYRPSFTPEMIERFTKRPDDFTVQRFRITGLRASIFAQYSKVIHGDTEERSLLELARPLAAFMGQLPDYTLKTRRGLSESAQRLRTAFNLAKSPERLLLEELPKALGFGNLERSQVADLEDFSQMLIEVLRELRDAHENLLSEQRKLLAEILNADSGVTLRELRKVAGQLYDLENYSSDTKGLNAFISRLTKVESDDASWFENLLMFLGHKPTGKWLDSDRDRAEYRLKDFAGRILELEKLRILEKEQVVTGGDVDFLLLRSVRKGFPVKDGVIAIDDALANRIADSLSRMKAELEDLGDPKAQLAALAKLADEYLKVEETHTELKVLEGGREE